MLFSAYFECTCDKMDNEFGSSVGRSAGRFEPIGSDLPVDPQRLAQGDLSDSVLLVGTGQLS